MSTHHGYLGQFPWIRVDAFDQPDGRSNPYTGTPPVVHLLTHAHTDHFAGLDSPAWDGLIYCTETTKNIVLGTQTAADRVRHMLAPESNRRYKFANLRGRDHRNGRKLLADRLRVIEYDAPIEFEGPNRVKVSITAIDANHCPGSVMFLISALSPAPPCAVLVTGDIRSEPSWVARLRLHPSLAPYITDPPGSSISGQWKLKLDTIYLDTSGVLRDEVLLPKQEAIDFFLASAKLYPADTRFFLNCWTWGYEDLLLAVHREFKTKIHFDPYKLRQYASMFKLGLATVGTKSESTTRFHGCERRLKCAQCYGDGRGCYDVPQDQLKTHLKGRLNKGRVVYVNPVEVGRKRFEEYKLATEAAFERGELPSYLMVPLARHSCLPELQSFVALFRPASVYPLVISPSAVEYTTLGNVFRDQLPPHAPERIAREAREYLRTQQQHRRRAAFPASSREVDPQERDEFELVRGGGWNGNVEGGEEAVELLEQWAREVGRSAKRQATADGDEVHAVPASEPWPSSTDSDGTPRTLLPSVELVAPQTAPAAANAISSPARSSPPSTPTPAQTASRTASGAIVPAAATRARRQALTSALHLTLRGLLGPRGQVIPFPAGDPRLSSRSIKRTRLTAEPIGEGGAEEARGGCADSFRTVPPTPEQQRRA